ncbi:MAG TPA: dethiobiotin synthase [Bryobacteraceae bacterium]|nr:dethiobiotin synthase [Bryobacteraceae bacterium]
MRGVFVTGTDTGVGKTVVSAALMLRYREARYWKPIQTGPDDDTAEVQRLSRCTRDQVYLHGVRLPDPVSPHLAAARAKTRINLQFLTDWVKASADSWIVEGAGGALVPLNESDLMIHLIERLGLPVVVTARTTLGTINHTLLTLEALRARRLTASGVVLVGDPNHDNRAAIERYGNVRILGEMPRFDSLTPDAVEAWAQSSLDPKGALGEFLG